jgi:hypothetical protein
LDKPLEGWKARHNYSMADRQKSESADPEPARLLTVKVRGRRRTWAFRAKRQ